MGGVCVCYSWTCRPMWPLFIILATMPCMLHSSESPPAAVGKMYPRGNHWAVGHLMGKKSIEPLQESEGERVYLSPSEAAGVTERLLEALMQQKEQKPADRLLLLHSGWRQEERDKYLREMSNLLLLALKLRDNGST
ncbi:gastrin-releasing peptide [Gymnodraco acuticeps]|uniref:Gastrin-releasing peptide n=1 Tax=Gymnodraco acuticeps TaxID=8218 RepID=A0A6P8V3W2_GYMAC|nr:gastrin-releasing peptide [Gymnodraco acuticeps]